jgi:hypothetical protein
VYEAVGSDHPGAGIAQDSELAVHNLLPDRNCVLAVVHADGYETGVESLKLFFVTRELAQLGGAIGSPVTAIEDQDDAFAAQRRKAEVFAFLILQGESRRGLALRRSDLRPRQDLRPGQRTEQNKDDNYRSRSPPHGPAFYSIPGADETWKAPHAFY